MTPRYITRADGSYRPHVLCGALGIGKALPHRTTHTQPTIDPLDCYQLWCLRSGMATVIDPDGPEASVLAPQLLMLCPATRSRITLYEASEYSWVQFGVRNLPLIPREQSPFGWKYYRDQDKPAHPLQPGPRETWGIDIPVCLPSGLYHSSLASTNMILAEWWRGEVGRALADALLGQWLVGLIRHLGVEEHTAAVGAAGRDGGWRAKAEHVLHDSMRDIGTVGHWAALLRMTPRAFSRRCLAENGYPPKEWLSRLKLNRAMELMMADEVTIGEVSAACGFGSRESFTRWFKRQTGVVPTAWTGVLDLRSQAGG